MSRLVLNFALTFFFSSTAESLKNKADYLTVWGLKEPVENYVYLPIGSFFGLFNIFMFSKNLYPGIRNTAIFLYKT